MLHVKLVAAALIVLPATAFAWNQDQSQNAVAKQNQAQMQHQVQRQGQKLVNAPTTNVTVTAPGGGVGGAAPPAAPSVNFAAPAWSLPSVGASGMDCPTVGLSAGGSGPIGGGGIGPSWISPDCNARKLAELLYNMGHPDIAMKVLADQYPVVRAAVPDAAPVSPPPKPLTANFSDRAAWCSATAFNRWSRAEQARHPECRN